MIPSYRVFGANRVSRCPSLLIAYRVQKRQVKSVPLAPASKERLPKDSTTRRGSLRLAACLVVSVLTWSALSLHRRAARIAARIYDPEFRHQRNLSHRDPWQQRHRNYVIPGTTETGGAPLQYFDWYLDAVCRGDSKRRQLPGSDRFLALWPRLCLSIRHC